ncbi:hypothetical protein [Niallia circulans]|nr:hypothetical protein [Niallia circulans]
MKQKGIKVDELLKMPYGNMFEMVGQWHAAGNMQKYIIVETYCY